MKAPEARGRTESASGERHDTVRAYVAVLFGLLPRKFLATLALMAGVGLTEGLGLLLLVPLLQLVGVTLGEGSASRLAAAGGAVLGRLGLTPTLARVLPIYLAVVAGGALLKRAQSIAIADLESSFVRQLRRRLFNAVLRTRWVFFSRSRSSTFLYALTSQATRVGNATDHLLPLISQLLVVAVYLGFAFVLAPALTLLVLMVGLALLLLLRPEARRAYDTGDRLAGVTGRLYGAVLEQLGGLKTARSYGAEERTARVFEELQGELVGSQLAAQRNFTKVRLGFEIGAAILLCLLLYVSVEVLQLAVAEVLLVVYLFGRVVPRFAGLQQSHQYIVNSLPAFRDVMRVTAECEAQSEIPRREAPAPIALHDRVRLRRVTFRYRPETTAPTIRELDLDILAHRTTAIVGPSGAGKTTIADLVLGLIAPESGRILVDDVVLGPASMAAWRELIGYVPQDAFLFHDTIRANLLWARPDATEGELREALRLAAAEPFVQRCPNGLDTIVGDRGVLLSGGERQRLALARALLRRPALLILDEATSSLDSENERQIQGAIEQLHGRTTILVITHRLSTIREADTIHVLENGRLRESGSWSELVRAGGRFVDLCRAQRITVKSGPREPTRLVARGG